MPKVYLLRTERDGDRMESAYHFFVPDSTNWSGYRIRQAVVEAFGQESLVPNLSRSEKRKIANGELFEVVHWVDFSANAPSVDKVHVALTEGVDEAREIYNEKLRELEFWGGFYDLSDPIEPPDEIADDFNRPDALDLGSNWSILTGDIRLEDNKAAGRHLTHESVAQWLPDSFSADQWSECQMYGAGGRNADGGPAVRIVNKANFYWFAIEDSGRHFALKRIVNGQQRRLKFKSASGFSEGDTLKLTVEGNKLTGYHNDNKVLSANDNYLSSGSTGFRGWKNRFRVDNWKAGNM